jgi:hypothetical protein
MCLYIFYLVRIYPHIKNMSIMLNTYRIFFTNVLYENLTINIIDNNHAKYNHKAHHT